jgi:hypothetical protein
MRTAGRIVRRGALVPFRAMDARSTPIEDDQAKVVRSPHQKRQHFLPSSLFACGKAANHTFRLIAHDPTETGSNGEFRRRSSS